MTASGFSRLARLTGKSGGIGDLRIAEYPGPLGLHDAGQIAKNIEDTLIDRIVDGLTGAHAGADAEAAAGGRDPREIVFAGTPRTSRGTSTRSNGATGCRSSRPRSRGSRRF